MAQKLFVGGLSWGTTEDALRDFFSQVGTVVSATIIKDKFTEKSKGFGFVEMETDEGSKAAIDQLNGQMLDGRPLTVNEARPMVPRDQRSGGRNRSFDRGDSRRNEDRMGTDQID
ncbi:hypothetical protein A3F32_01080 [Candidatus Roizmanbacteria bacterium RIFCSPHIGHO2_12_FULL_42_10]|uniref:RRM domain-containing protein n=2 Tax=Candidatus Roizmaniibacteriota TaxID=1752723 RepID=A0A1F7I4X9_9BACT|nr:MAG: hypothetical protein A3D08_02115 [Candidatus Roizmanbacteria bacterium RIFCSPHIGHO2_02_FULL_43_11]OGK38423.1 MAG: hypothetical protein A3F32_01080 [Candidatus Roizmanbacteria bacterium RIFCSPHIGHO2_12_FULL_42_10]